MNPKKNFRLHKPRRRSKSSSKDIHTQDHKAFFHIPQGELDLFHYMVDHIGDEVIVADQQARIVFVNKAAVKGLGYTKENILGRKLTDFFEKKISVKQWQKTYFSEVKRTKKPVSYLINRVGKSRKIRTVDMTVAYMPYMYKDYVLTVGRDITEQIAFQSKLKESEDRYRLLSEQAADGILMIDTNGITFYANKAAGRMFKTTAAKLIGSHFETHVDETSLSKVWKYFRKVKSGVPIVNSDLEIKDQKGNIVPVEFTASPIFRNGKVVQIHVIFRDINEKMEMEALRRESEKMEAFQNFIAGTTHEIQQPLKGLRDHTQSLIDRYQDRYFEYIGFNEFKDIMKTLQTMNDQVKYCFDTTDRLNSLNRRKAKLEDSFCNVNSVIRDTMSKLKHSLDVSDIKVVLKLNSRLPHVAINTLYLNQVLNNIITNAIQSLPGSRGKIQIKTTYQKMDETVRIDCQDDGVGIPNDILARVFDPFFTTKPRGLEKNSGLGLYIVYSIIKAHQGEIFVKSNFRKGTFVTILLPVYKFKKKRKSS